MKMLSSKRGNWVDIFEYSRGILILGISIIITFILLSMFNNIFISNASNGGILNDSTALGYMQTTVDYFNVWDYIIPIIYVFFLGFSAWSASKIESSHKFVFIGVLMLIIVTLFSLFIEVMWDSFTSESIISPYLASFPFTNIFISYLRYFVLFYGLIVGLALYAKTE